MEQENASFDFFNFEKMPSLGSVRQELGVPEHKGFYRGFDFVILIFNYKTHTL